MSIRNIFILSRAEAEKFDPATVQTLPAALVSITEPFEVLPNFVHGHKYDVTMRYQFHDITPNTAWEMGKDWRGEYFRAMTQDQAYDLATHIAKIADSMNTLVVHCAAGISRSSAIALSVAEFLALSHIVQDIHNSPRYFPNGHVLRLMRNAFGTNKEGNRREEIEQMYGELFANCLVPWNQEEK